MVNVHHLGWSPLPLCGLLKNDRSVRFISMLGFYKSAVVTSMLMAMTLSFTGLSHAAYIIQLKNGREFVTERYWEEGNRVMVETYGGILAVAKESIQKIEFTNRTVPRESSVEPSSSAPSGQMSGGKIPSTKSQDAASSPKDLVEPQEKEAAVIQEFRALQQAFNQLNDLPRVEVFTLSQRLESFKKKILEKNTAATYEKELQAANAMAKAIQGYLKASGQ